MQVVVELPQFIRAAAAAGMSERDVRRVIDLLASNPLAGVSLGGGLRKVRIARDGGGKSGGYRTIHFYSAPDIPVFLITCFAKNQRDSISDRERAQLIALCAELEAGYRR